MQLRLVFMKNKTLIPLVIIITVLVTTFTIYLLQSRAGVDISRSKGYGNGDYGNEDGNQGDTSGELDNQSNYSNPQGNFYDWWLCTIGAGVCPATSEDATGPRRR